jgi:hypothetical protein
MCKKKILYKTIGLYVQKNFYIKQSGYMYTKKLLYKTIGLYVQKKLLYKTIGLYVPKKTSI